jgi:hypothetical protein
MQPITVRFSRERVFLHPEDAGRRQRRTFMRYFTAVLLIFGITFALGARQALGATHEKVNVLPGEGKKIAIIGDHYFVYEFTKRPALGTAILRVRVFDGKGRQQVPYAIFGEYGMPSMPGHHDSGKVAFKLNKKGDYLLPVNIVMPGDWQVVITVEKDGKVLVRGAVRFDV